MRRGLRNDALPKVAHAIEALRYVEKFGDAGMSRELADAVWSFRKTEGTNWKAIMLLAERRVFVRSKDTND